MAPGGTHVRGAVSCASQTVGGAPSSELESLCGADKIGNQGTVRVGGTPYHSRKIRSPWPVVWVGFTNVVNFGWVPLPPPAGTEEVIGGMRFPCTDAAPSAEEIGSCKADITSGPSPQGVGSTVTPTRLYPYGSTSFA